MRLSALKSCVPGIAVLAAFAVVAAVMARRPLASTRSAPVDLIGSLGAPVADPNGLSTRIATLETRLAANPADHAAGIALAEALVRQSRVTGNAAFAARGEQRLRAALTSDPGDYEAQRLLGVVLLSLHRFDEAVAAGERARAMRPDDAFVYGVIGDGLLELGRYHDAFTAFQRMVDMRPNAASYARASYAQELQGDLDGALHTMHRAANATSPRDAEGLAWTWSQVGDLLLRLDRLAEADACYRRALALFPGHPFAIFGQARVLAARSRDDEAMALAVALLQRAPALRLAAFIGDLHARNRRPREAERLYAMAEAIGRDTAATDESLAGFLAERDRKLDEAVSLAERAAARRQDVHTLDALAWAYFRAGRLQDAATAADKATAIGTRERRVVLHAAAIKAALGDAAAARALASRAALRDPDFDLLAGRQVPRALAIAAREQHLRDVRASP
jgi:tetratricopeptide (TPR) repeat protein